MAKTLIDTAEIKIKAGDGGDGRVSFRREKFVPKGGPDGGDGGDGGSVYMIGTKSLATLMDFRSKHKYAAKDGEPGGKKNMGGASSPDLYIRVPVGTQVFEITDTHDILIGDITHEGQSVLIAQGGKGGKGNSRFKSSTNTTPRQFTKGTQGETKNVRLEVKLIADVGFVGMPNAGKSTLINQITNAGARTDSYPFTTLIPNLGVAALPSGNKIVIADIPGLIEGASEGKGLGDDFLRHIERTRLIVHLIDPLDGLSLSEEDLEDNRLERAMAENSLNLYKKIRHELETYKPLGADKSLQLQNLSNVASKKEVVVINKIDVTEVYESLEFIKERFKKEGIEVLGLSAVTGEGVQALLQVLDNVLETIPVTEYKTEKVTKVYSLGDLPNKRIIFGEEEEVELPEM